MSTYIGGKNPDEKPDLKFWVLQIFNLMNVILGSGILAMPYVMATVGYGTFMISLAGVAVLGLFAIDNLTILCEKFGISSYEELANKALGTPGKMYTIACIYFHTLIAKPQLCALSTNNFNSRVFKHLAPKF